jgi:hypothetical protein
VAVVYARSGAADLRFRWLIASDSPKLSGHRSGGPGRCRDLVGLIREPIPKLVVRFVFRNESVERLALLGARVRWALAVAGDRT